MLAAGRRIVSGTHALASHLQDAQAQVAVPAASGIVSQMRDSMTELARSVASGQPPVALPDLRLSQRRLAAASAGRQTLEQRRGAILAALLDPLVDSIDTAASVLRGDSG